MIDFLSGKLAGRNPPTASWLVHITAIQIMGARIQGIKKEHRGIFVV
jgi:hypothetical protein